jgi:hypothetical protein
MPTPTLRPFTTGALALLTSLAAVACGDVPSAPRASAAPSALAPSAAPARAVYTVGDTTVTTFTYNPLAGHEQTFAGTHKLTMPARAVCDLLLSGYGPALWDAPCVPTLLPVAFTARAWRDAAGHPHIRFSPDVRFVPGAVVTLRLKDQTAATQGLGTIVWCPTGQTTCLNEALTDASMQTRYEPQQGFVYRRLKHFSGYNVVVDRDGSGSGGDEGTGFGGGF